MTATAILVTGRQYLIGCPAYCADGPCGYVAVLVVARATGKLAHLIVMPEHGSDSRLVPASMARPEGDTVRLDCTSDDFRRLRTAVDIRMLPMEPDEALRSRHDRIPPSPYFGLGPSGTNLGLAAPEPVLPPLDYEDHVPPNEVRVYPGDHVHALDGSVGRVRGVVTALEDDTVTYILLDEGHLWTRKRVGIPMEMVEKVDDEGVRVRLTKHQVKELPPVEVAESA